MNSTKIHLYDDRISDWLTGTSEDGMAEQWLCLKSVVNHKVALNSWRKGEFSKISIIPLLRPRIHRLVVLSIFDLDNETTPAFGPIFFKANCGLFMEVLLYKSDWRATVSNSN